MRRITSKCTQELCLKSIKDNKKVGCNIKKNGNHFNGLCRRFHTRLVVDAAGSEALPRPSSWARTGFCWGQRST